MPKSPAEKELAANADVAEEPRTNVKCDNHPDRKARTFTGNGSYEIHLCPECTPAWFTADE